MIINIPPVTAFEDIRAAVNQDTNPAEEALIAKINALLDQIESIEASLQ